MASVLDSFGEDFRIYLKETHCLLEVNIASIQGKVECLHV